LYKPISFSHPKQYIRCFSSDYKTLSPDGGYWQEQIPKSEAALCAAIDPAADFRWHSLNCGGPETASFICELPGMYL
jgi:hypothetical protein